ncbi:Coenzyme A transferase family I [Acididesulfobacillus acetoxydans]|uniref:3-oxoadipate CoA-transferase subunit A n=1 Tax=Acididesulfobacillus acetoxydans TaxID=1561005 RepID=A0A8S0XBD6_9FIRM|nr:CoA-transferase [Acididesulfobacillus acetoxydans]CAA7601106.1 Coenzyme A transferase family I [Acididesulfobacillus acetoxydans]CEJ06980.1 3-oxoadipate CoA-transferase subunit A [Acididesulfobacillus acetoxydans]
MERTRKVIPLSEAIRRFVPDDCPSLAVGGMHMHNNPMALIREVIRQNKKIKRLITSPSADINADLLLGSGLVEEILTAYVGFEHLGLAPNFRRAVEKKTVKLLECDEPFLVYGFQAGAGGLPFIPYPKGLELNDLHKIDPEFYRFTTDPYTGEQVMTAAPLKPSVALIHCQEADPYGNAIFKGSEFTDRQMILAAETVVLQVEKIVPDLAAKYGATRVNVPGFLVSAVVEAPYGCHPTSSHGYYRDDEGHLRAYLQACKSPESWTEYLHRYVLDIPEEEYAATIGRGRLNSLRSEGVFE